MSAPNQLSFLPDDYLARKAIRRTNAIFAILFIVTIGACGAGFWHAKTGVKLAREKHDAAQADKSNAARPIEQFQKLQEKQRTMAMQAELTSSLIEKVPRSFLLAELTNALPTGVSLVDLTLDSRKKAVARPPTPKATFEVKAKPNAAAAEKDDAAASQVQPIHFDVTMKVTGVAANDVQVAQFITKLNGSRLLKDVNLLISDEFKKGDDALRKFQIEMSVNPSAEIDPLGGDHQTKTAAVDLTSPVEKK